MASAFITVCIALKKAAKSRIMTFEVQHNSAIRSHSSIGNRIQVTEVSSKRNYPLAIVPYLNTSIAGIKNRLSFRGFEIHDSKAVL